MPSTFTVLVGTACRPVLKNMLDSIQRQERVPGDQVIVSIDAFERGEMLEVQDLVRSYGEGFIATSYVGVAQEEKHMPDGRVIQPGEPYHWLGVEQINHALRTIPITGSHIFTIGDDDVFVDGAYRTLRQFTDADPLRPIIYKFQAPNRWLLWDKPRMRPCLISGCCIAAPRKYVDLMHTRIETTHDYDWMMEILNRAAFDGKEPLWLDYVGVLARPDQIGNDVRHAGIWQCAHCRAWRYLEDFSPLRHPHCPQCGAVTDVNNPPRVVQAIDPSID